MARPVQVRLGTLLAIAYAVVAVAWVPLERRRPGWRSNLWPEIAATRDPAHVALAA